MKAYPETERRFVTGLGMNTVQRLQTGAPIGKSSQQLVHYFAVNIGQTKIATLKTVGQSLVVDAQ